MPPKLRMMQPAIRTLDTRTVKVAAKVADPFYKSIPWRHLLASIIEQRGRRCEDREHRGDADMTGKMIYGDHVVEMKDGGAPLDPSNVLLRCPSCHTRKTLRTRAERMRSPSREGGSRSL